MTATANIPLRKEPVGRNDRVLLRSVLWLLIILLSIGVVTYRIHWLQARVDADIARIKADGFPTTFDELNLYRPVTDVQNVSQSLLQGAPLVVPESPEVYQRGHWGNRRPWQILSPAEAADLDDSLKKNEPALAFFDRATKVPDAKFRCTYSMDRYADSRCVIIAVNQLNHRAQQAAQRGDAATAVQAILDGLKIQETLRDPCDALSLNMLCVSLDDNASAIERVLNQVSLSDTQLQSIAAALDSLHVEIDPVRAVAGDRTRYIEAIRHDDWYSLEFSFEGERRWSDLASVELRPIEQHRLLAFIESTMSEKPVPPEKQRVVFSADRRRVNAPAFFFPVLATNAYIQFDSAAFNSTQNVTHLRCIRTLVAVERYKLARHAIPGTLDDLAPAFLPVIPIDPVTAKPMYFKPYQDGYQIYSDISANGGWDIAPRKLPLLSNYEWLDLPGNSYPGPHSAITFAVRSRVAPEPPKPPATATTKPTTQDHDE